jgi:hypothetical protein
MISFGVSGVNDLRFSQEWPGRSTCDLRMRGIYAGMLTNDNALPEITCSPHRRTRV